MSIIIDRRLNGKGKSSENRKKFLMRVRAVIKEQLPRLIADRNITDMAKGGGRVRVPSKSIQEPTFSTSPGGHHDYVLPGNEEFIPGDSIRKPYEGPGSRGSGAGTGEGEDDFFINISREEFLDYLFDGLELPDLVHKDLSKVKEIVKRHAGYQLQGAPNKLSIIRSFRQSLSRRIPIKASYDHRIEELQEQLESNLQNGLELDENLLAEIQRLERRRDRVPFLDPIDMRYKQTLIEHRPSTHATMIMIMDNSGSMGEHEKTIAKKFFFLLYSFLQRQYAQVDLVFISHTEIAHEMTEDEFFNTSISGGTLVSSALDLTDRIIRERLMNRTNVYVSQVSDGDNMTYDDDICKKTLLDKILPLVQYYAYIQVDDYHAAYSHQVPLAYHLNKLSTYEKGLWKAYQEVASAKSNFQMKRVSSDRDIFPVFKQLFEKREK